MSDRPTLLDYIVFFETEPEWTDPAGWYFGARFSTQRGDDRVVATIAPDEMEFEVEWWQRGISRIRLKSVRVIKWEIEMSSTRELLRLSYNAHSVKSCELQLKPHIHLDWAMTW